MDFKLAEYADFERISMLHTMNLQHLYQGLLSEQYLDGDLAQERTVLWQTRLTNPPYGQHVLLAEEGGLLLGFICLFGNHDFERGCLIDSIHVDLNFQRRGIGKALMRRAAVWQGQYFPDSGLYLKVADDNHAALAFYQALGGEIETRTVGLAKNSDSEPELLVRWSNHRVLLDALSCESMS